MTAPTVEDRVRTICLAFPGVTERLSHGAPAFFSGRQFLQLWTEGHHEHAFPHLWSAAPVGGEDELIAVSPGRYFRPPYVGGRGWVGMRLDRDVSWGEVAAACEDAYRAVAPNKLPLRQRG